MKKIFRKLSLVLGLMMFSVLMLNVTNVSAKDLSNELVKLDYTIDEIREMSLGEYYSNIFPEVFAEFDLAVQEELFNTPYESSLNPLNDGGFMNASSTLTKTSSSEVQYRALTQMTFTDGSKAKQIHHSSLIYDDAGTTWMIRSDRKADSNYFDMKGPKSVSKGRYKMETVHTVDMPKGYWPTTVSRTTTSPWVIVN